MKLLWTLFIFLFAAVQAWGDLYYAKYEPLQEHVIKSNVSGRVSFADESIEGKVAGSAAIILIESELDRANAKLLEHKEQLLAAQAQTDAAVFNKKSSYYDSIKNLKTKSQTNIDTAFYAKASAQQQWFNTQMQLDATRQELRTLKKTLKDKQITYEGWYLYALHVKAGDFVTLGTPLVTVSDTKKAKLTLFLSEEDARTYEDKKLFINDQPTPAKIERVWKIADEKKISSYQATIIVDAPTRFSTLAKIELKSAP